MAGEQQQQDTNSQAANQAGAAAGSGQRNHPWPEVDEQYWLSRAKTMLDNPQESWDNTVKNLNKFILYIYGLYTAGVVAGTTITRQDVPTGMLIILGTPYLFLFIAYGLLHFANFPIATAGRNGDGFDPSSPDEIRDAVNELNKKRMKRLQWTLWPLGAGLIMTGFGLMYAFQFRKPATAEPKTKVQFRDYDLTTHYIQEGRSAYININGNFPAKAEMQIKLEEHFLSKTQKPQDSAYSQLHSFTAPDSGTVSISIPVHDEALWYNLQLSHPLKDTATRISVTKRINRPVAKKPEDNNGKSAKEESKTEQGKKEEKTTKDTIAAGRAGR